ncbi:MAG TPA: imidazoleglycerol-phosphate dehydratase HisB [Thermodesulfobacteriota bacterium]|nr:imidazoleglycerol-phosphate dehydratase HisB [Thermodesulfobacteriota bacterium]
MGTRGKGAGGDFAGDLPAPLPAAPRGRRAEVVRTTRETDIRLVLDLDGQGRGDVETGVPFLDHMLAQVARHGLFDLEIRAKGDTHVDDHHVVEDVAICFGQALAEALGDRRGIRRYGSCTLPMIETLVTVALDLSGRGHFVYRVTFPGERIGTFATELVEEFFRALADRGGVELHINLHYGTNQHHMAEAIFKAFARALDDATRIDPRLAGEPPSTKGVLEGARPRPGGRYEG